MGDGADQTMLKLIDERGGGRFYQTRDPASTPHGEVNIRVIDAGALLEAPLDDGRSSVLAAGRYGFPGPIVGEALSYLLDLRLDEGPLAEPAAFARLADWARARGIEPAG